MATKRQDVFEKFGGAPHSKQSLRLWLRMLSCTTRIENIIRERLRVEFDTTLPRFDVLAALERNPEGLSMGELSRCLMVSNGNVTGVVNRLEAEGLLTRSPSPKDRRTHRVKLTTKGMQQFKHMASVHEGWIDELFSEISTSEAETLLGHLARVQHSLAQASTAGDAESSNHKSNKT